MAIAKKVAERMTTGLKRLVPVILQQQARDVSEADTVTVIKDILSEVFGYDKYTEITGEHAIRGTFCDLAVKIEEKLVELIEVTPAIVENCFSSGSATAAAIVSGLAPGSAACT